MKPYNENQQLKSKIPEEKKYENLTLKSDFMFCRIMKQNPELCREIAEILIEEPVGELEFIESHFEVKESADGKGVVFDVIAKDSNTCYNIEMQVAKEKALGKRVRYYRGITDATLLEAGQSYNELFKAFVIFICAYDPFKTGLVKYTFRQTCEQVPQANLGDDAAVIIINLASTQLADTNERFRNLVSYLAGHEPQDNLGKKLDKAVQEARKNTDWRSDYMNYMEHIKVERAEAYEEGDTNRLKTDICSLHEAGFDIEMIMRGLKVSRELVEETLGLQSSGETLSSSV